MQNVLHKYLQYSKRIAIFGIAQWAVLAALSLVIVIMFTGLDISIEEWVARVVNNVVTCSSALAIAICSGYYAHSAYDNNLKNKLAGLNIDGLPEEQSPGNG